MELITPAAKAAATIMSVFDINWFLASEFQVESTSFKFFSRKPIRRTWDAGRSDITCKKK
jgi:hypothetical protein